MEILLLMILMILKQSKAKTSMLSAASLLDAARKHALARGIKPSILVALADHESGLDPNVGVTKLQNASNSNTAAGAWQMTKPTAEWLEPGSYSAILAGDVETQARTAAILYVKNRASVGAGEPGAILAHWLGAGGAKKILIQGVPHSTGGVHGTITVSQAMDYIDDIMTRSQKYLYLDSAAIA